MKHGRTAVLALVLTVLLFSESGAQEFLFEWGQTGAADGQFNFPSGIAVDSQANLYVADTGNDRIQKFDGQGTFLLKWGSPGGGAAQFNSPRGVAVDSLDNVYVVDSANQRVQKFTSNGNFITAWGSAGSGPGRFDQPVGIAVDSRDYVYVTDYGNNRVQAFDSAGVFKLEWGSAGTDHGRFSGPQAITVWTDGEGTELVYVGDENSRIQGFDPDGTFRTEFTSAGQYDGQFNGIGGIGAVDGDLLASDRGNHRVQEYGTGGAFILNWGMFGKRPGAFDHPAGLVGTSAGLVYVVDSGNNRIQTFGAPLPPTIELGYHSFNYRLSWTNTRAIDTVGFHCTSRPDTAADVSWIWTLPTSLGLGYGGKTYSGFQSRDTLVLTTMYMNGDRLAAEQLELTVQSPSRAVGSVYLSEVDPAGNYCLAVADAEMSGTPPVITPVTTPTVEGGFFSGGLNMGGGGGCFIGTLAR